MSLRALADALHADELMRARAMRPDRDEEGVQMLLRERLDLADALDRR